MVAPSYTPSMAETLANLTGFFRLWEESRAVVLRDLKCPERSSWEFPDQEFMSEVLEGSIWSLLHSRNTGLLSLSWVECIPPPQKKKKKMW